MTQDDCDPQLENGYTRIANELLEAMSNKHLAGSELSIMLTIIRKTYGFGKKVDNISLTQLQKATGMCRRSVCRLKKSLGARNILVIKGKSIGINKKWNEWIVAPKLPLIKSRGTDCPKSRGTKYTHKRKKESIVVVAVDKPHAIAFDGNKFQNITEQQIQTWQLQFPSINVPDQLSTMEAWLSANPNRRKKNYARFIINWLIRQKPKPPPPELTDPEKRDIAMKKHWGR